MGGEGIHNPADLGDIETDLETALAYLIYIYGEVVGLNGEAMRGTDNAALAAYYTAVRGGYLDELAAANIPDDVDTLLARLTALRAGYLDELGPTNIPADLAVIEQEVYEIEKHIHTNEKWFGLADIPSGETHRADRMGPAIGPFALLSGDDDFGGWIQILGSADTPVATGMTKFDIHRILVTTTNSTNPFLIHIVDGELADIGAKLLAEDFTEVPYIAATNNADSGIEDVKHKRADDTTKAWARCICIGAANKTINFYHGLHEYAR